jgi:hypothetical protein
MKPGQRQRLGYGAMGCKMERPWLDFGQKDARFLFSKLTKLTVEATHSPIRWVPGALSCW